MSSHMRAVCVSQMIPKLCLVPGLVLLAVMTSAAQVTIKDTVIISPGSITMPGDGPLSPTTTDTFFIAPHPGALALVPWHAYKLGSPFLTGSYLEIQLSDTTYTPALSTFLSCSSSQPNVYWDTCGTSRSGTQYYQDPCETLNTFYTRRLQTGDTVRFAFQGEFYNTTSAIYFEDDHGSVDMTTPAPCQQAYDPHEVLWADFHLMDTVITIIRPDSAVVYPTYPGHNNAGAANDSIDLELRVTYKNDSIPNYWVKIERPVLVDSGGHSHDGNRPMGRYKYPTTLTGTLDTIQAQTDSHGKLKFRYVASQFGGVELIKARALSDTAKFDTLSIMTRVPELVDFAAIPSEYWGLTGNTGNTNAPKCGSSVPIRHYSNHLATQATIDSLKKALRKFYTWASSTKGAGQAILGINDMGLEKGGVFDIQSDWNTTRCHAFHRVGRSVDIDNSNLREFWYQDEHGRNHYRFTEPRGVKLNELVGTHGGHHIDEGTVHFQWGKNE